ncbi:MAG: response regulator [Holophagaceae bacterium]|nr:response regulator [Holophagaceae bacterium]
MLDEPILIVDDESSLLMLLQDSLAQAGFRAVTVGSAHEALKLVRARHFPVVLTDLYMPGGPSGLELIQAIRAQDPLTLCIVMTAFASVESAIEALQLGAYDFLRKPFRQQELHAALNRALDHGRLKKEVETYRTNLENLVLERTRDVQALCDDVVRLNDLTLAAQDRAAQGPATEAELLQPFFDDLALRHRPDGYACALVEGGRWRYALTKGSRPWPEAATLAASPNLMEGGEALEWRWDQGYPDAFLIPLRAAGELLGAVLVGYDARGAFSPAERGMALWRRQVEALVHGMRTARHLVADAAARARQEGAAS